MPNQPGQMLLLAGIQPLLQVGPVTNSCMEMSFLSVFNALLLYHSRQLLSQRKKGRGPSPANRHKKAPEGSFAATLRGKDNDQCLLVGVLDPDRQADVALLGVGQDHDTDLGPGTILLHIALDADRNIHGSLNGLQ